MPAWRFWSRGQDECCEDSIANVQMYERQTELLKGCFWAKRLFGFLSYMRRVIAYHSHVCLAHLAEGLETASLGLSKSNKIWLSALLTQTLRNKTNSYLHFVFLQVKQ